MRDSLRGEPLRMLRRLGLARGRATAGGTGPATARATALSCFDAAQLTRGRRWTYGWRPGWGPVWGPGWGPGWAHARGRRLDPEALVFSAVDLETTGLEPGVDRVCEIGVVRFRADGSVLGEYSTLVDPQRPMDATSIHGIAADQVIGAPTFAQVAPELERLLAGTVVVAHNLAFEDAFLAAEFRAARLPVPRWPGLCTLVTARAQLDGRGFGLAALHRSLTDTPVDAAHTALGDSRATAELLAALLAQSPAPLRYRGPRPRRVLSPLPAAPLCLPREALTTSTATEDHPRHTWRPRELAPQWGRPAR